MLTKATADLSARLQDLLRQSAAVAGPDFSGMGVLVTKDASRLPIFPLRVNSEIDSSEDTKALLGRIAVNGGPLHDGFHILSPGLGVIALAQYFSPPIVPSLPLDRSRPFGGRYLAALFGSALEGIWATGIATPTLGVITFADGRETAAAALR